MKFIFVTGGVLSGLGKGITASSIGRLLKSRGINVSAIKIDPYLNLDAGTMDPFEHGEVYVLDDGAEVDLDLGNYERFMDAKLDRDHNITTGKVYASVIEKERRGEFRGKTVQIIPHITNEIKESITRVARNTGADVMIVEIGGTVGDIEAMPFLEAVRQLGTEVGRKENCTFVHTTLIPLMGTAKEPKTKPTQHSVKELMSLGIMPDMIVGRSSVAMTEEIRKKISLFCDVPLEAVVSAPDAPSIYQVPITLEEQGVADFIIRRMRLTHLAKKLDLREWNDFLSRVADRSQEVTIALVGKYTRLTDTYLSHMEAFTHAGAHERCRPNMRLIDSDDITPETAEELLGDVHGILVPGGFGQKGVDGKIHATTFARERGIPFTGVCLGFQLAAIEIARNVLGLEGANSVEFDPDTPHPIVNLLPGQEASMRLGSHAVTLAAGSLAHKLYGKKEIAERHRHIYDINPDYAEALEEAGWKFTGHSESGRAEFGELEGHPYFVGSQFHPEFKSRPCRPTPMHLGLVRAAIAYRERGGA